ncbi:GlxA family transcriptional regulator [Methylacidimicrobium sp. B4]|uniref:GlxA family transcriptional regulator n=1 Tax=Methylacidimicrobium sp. B4 TaxID=2796139 RepID=UPI001A8C2316|nr:GlxA family transcriptional regulator [Methylacidimicrobium sp. B4]QSR84926.1 GlxA family transcriptional regulator [Methylacidimicrobium sp. B4]
MEPPFSITTAIPLLWGVIPVSVVGPAHLLGKIGSGFAGPCRPCGPGRFRVHLLSVDGRPVELESMRIRSDGALGEMPAPDLIYVPGPEADFEQALERNRPYLDWIRTSYARGATVATSCSGALFLAEAGLLHGRRATTHWCHADYFRKRYPEVRWQISRLVVEDGRVITAGGATAYLNLMIQLAERFLGREQALAVARFTLVDPERNSQLPYMVRLNQQPHGDSVVRRAQEFLSEAPEKPLSLPELAASCGVSPRTLLRRFRTALGESPGEYRQGLRIERAKQLLANTDRTVEEIVAEVGYDDSRSFRRLFLKQVGISPKRYRRKFTVFCADPEKEEAASESCSCPTAT